MNNPGDAANTITFLGTAGARFMVSRQIAASGGMWLNLGGTQILIDPGPGSIVQSTKRKLRGDSLDAIILSHRHLDHSGDINVMIEAMTNGGWRRRGSLFAPSDALSDEPVVFTYLRGFVEDITRLEAGGSYRVDGVAFSTPVRHVHPVETYGMVFEAGGHRFSYISDTRYFEGLAAAYAAEMVIINVVFLDPPARADHLTVPDVARLVSEIRPKIAIMSHFGMHVWQAHPWELAERLTQETGFKVIAARDGMKFDLARLDGEE
jgi:phosphoribosyl 1,2-cyclic phosphodiesterase